MKPLTTARTGLVLALAAAFVILACSGGDGGASTDSTAATGSVPPATATTESTETSTSPTAAASTPTAAAATAIAQPSATADAAAEVIARNNSITPVPVEDTGDLTDDVLGGSPDLEAEAGITDVLGAAGFDLSGVEVYVFPITGTGEALLAFSVDEAQAGALIEADGDALLATLLSAPQIAEANITRLALNYFGRDEAGAYRITLAAPIETLRDLASGAISEEAAASEIAYEVVR